jgi:hypothetical protein
MRHTHIVLSVAPGDECAKHAYTPYTTILFHCICVWYANAPTTAHASYTASPVIIWSFNASTVVPGLGAIYHGLFHSCPEAR